ncbi:MAG: hypothetical protein ABIB43_05810 [archaeon]
MSLSKIIKKSWKENKGLWIASGVFLAGNILDYTGTVEGMKLFGTEPESNPIFRYYADTMGIEKGLMFSKSIITGTIFGGLNYFHRNIDKHLKPDPKFNPKIMTYTLLSSLGIYAAMAGNLWRFF